MKTQEFGNQFEVGPFIDALEYVVGEGRKALALGDNEALVAVARAANAALLWHEADKAQRFEEAEKYLKLIPRC